MESCHLPLELCICIIRYLDAPEDLGSLKEAVLVCRAWSEMVQSQMFRTAKPVRLLNKTFQVWLKRLESSPHIEKHIENIYLTSPWDQGEVATLELLTSRLRHIKRLQISENGFLPTGPPGLLGKIQHIVVHLGTSPAQFISLLTSMPKLHDLTIIFSPVRAFTHPGEDEATWGLARRMLLQGETQHIKLRRLSLLVAKENRVQKVEKIFDFLLLPMSFDFQHLRILKVIWPSWNAAHQTNEQLLSLRQKYIDLAKILGPVVEDLVVVQDHANILNLYMLGNKGASISACSLFSYFLR